MTIFDCYKCMKCDKSCIFPIEREYKLEGRDISFIQYCEECKSGLVWLGCGDLGDEQHE